MNVVLIVSDDQRPDTVHALGNRVIHTPNLDALVGQGTAFTRATCANPICTPSRAELMTGCTGFRNGVLDFGGKAGHDVPRWAATMRDAGYRTCYVGKWHNDDTPRTYGYEETEALFTGGGARSAKPQTDWKGRRVTGYVGWVFRGNDGRPHPEFGVGLTPDISSRIADGAVRFLERRAEPFFLHVNFTAPHDPRLMPPGYESKYDPSRIPVPENFLPEHPFDHGNLRGRDEQLLPWPRTKTDVREELACYYAVISHMDEQIGRILRVLDRTGQAENTLVIFTSDNGLAIGSHGLRGKQSMYDHTIGVPLIMRGPGIPKRRRTEAQCYVRDLFPTACELVRLKAKADVEGRSLVPVMNGKTREIYPEVFGYFRQHQRMIRRNGWKYIWYPQIRRSQLFHLESDPHEMRDLSGESRHARTLQVLREALAGWQRQVGDPAVG